MTAHGFVVFDTAIGTCGVAWSEAGLVGVQLPEGSEPATRARVRRRFPTAAETSPPPDVRRAIDAVRALLRGEPTDLSAIVLDMADVPAFNRRIYDVARTILPGETRTYGALATAIGAPGEARAVGEAMGRNPFPLVVPCHRVLAAGGRLGGFSARGGAVTKRRLLVIEGAVPRELFDAVPAAARSRNEPR